MQEIKCKFLNSIERTHNVKSFRFALTESFDFKVGQFVQVVLDEENRENKTLNKMLSLSCCPGEGYIEVTKKISESVFSKKLLSLQEGDEVLFKGPMGSLTIESLNDKCCFLVGGIGVTPVFPMFQMISREKKENDIVMLYSNWTENDIAFKEDFDAIEKDNDNLKVVHVLSESQREEYLKGFITDEIIRTAVPDFMDRKIFIWGPPKMVETMQGICEGLGIPKENVKVESFMGY